MQLCFREFNHKNPSDPLPGEIHLRGQSAEDRSGRALATLALEQGLVAFPRGSGSVERIVIQADPTFDDMLAALFVERLLAGQKLPRGAKSFALYAALAREGLKPCRLPVEDSLAGFYLAVRREAGDKVIPTEERAKFLAAWSPMAERIAKAMDAGEDPFTTALFATDLDFARLRTYLAHDRNAYYRQDVPGGERWLVRLPGGPITAAGLLLRLPQSKLWKFWSRDDPEAPGGKGYLFLAVFEEEKHWVFSTDPVHMVPIRSLAQRLQQAELASDPVGAKNDPWFDGKRFEHRLIGAPSSGTSLSDQQVIRIVKKWAHAHRFHPEKGRSKISVLAYTGLVLLLGFVIGWSVKDPFTSTRGLDWLPEPPSDGTRPEVPGAKPVVYILAVGVSNYNVEEIRLRCAANDARDLAKAFKGREGTLFSRVFECALTDKDVTRASLGKELEKLGEAARRASKNDLVVVTFAGHGRKHKEQFRFLPSNFDPKEGFDQTLSWDDIRNFLTNLPCTVLVLMDTCHSGTITDVKQLLQFEGKMVILAACSKDESSLERQSLGHGVFTMAILEGLRGEFHLPKPEDQEFAQRLTVAPGSPISLLDLIYYVCKRVDDMVGDLQTVSPINTSNVKLHKLFIGVREAQSPQTPSLH
jgi:hypothetical protein